jgi:hypothetical protein
MEAAIMECTKCPFNKILCDAKGCVMDVIAAHVIEVQKPAHNNARDEILQCRASHGCRYKFETCLSEGACEHRYKTSPVA